ncbi:MAG: hypothetical protein LBO70_05150, partial [Clostridiales Family XIII bacterium]|nr:hypothetical protein [Clostridiales Family XIII bacterium]
MDKIKVLFGWKREQEGEGDNEQKYDYNGKGYPFVIANRGARYRRAVVIAGGAKRSIVPPRSFQYFPGGGLQKFSLSGNTAHGASAGESAARFAICAPGGDVMKKRALSYFLALTLVLGIFLGYGWGTPDMVRAVGFGPQAEQAAEPPHFAQPPSDSTYSKDADARFYVRAESRDGGYLTYQWYRSAAYSETSYSTIAAEIKTLGGLSDETENAIKAGGAAFEKGGAAFGGNTDADGTKSILTCKTPDDEGVNYYFYWVTVTNHKDIGGGAVATAELDSELATVKVVDRKLFDAVQYGDFEYFYGGYDQRNNAGMRREWNDGSITGFPPSMGYFDTTHEGTPFPSNNYHNAGKQFQEVSGVNGGPGNDSNGIEMSNFRSSSIYQEIATVPGKIYEWSMQHATLASATWTDPDVVAVVIGPAINEESDYAEMQSVDPGVINYWNKVDPAEFNNQTITTNKSSWCNPPFDHSYGASPTYVAPELTKPENGGDYSYGVNMYTHFNAIAAKALADNKVTAADYNANGGANFNDIDRAYATNYGGKLYYVFVSAAKQKTGWYTRSGSYTVPDGQGTTVFGFVSVSSPGGGGNGNLLDNIVFASGTDLSPESDTSYNGDTQLSARTRVGFAYGLAEVRGSSIMELSALEAYYSASGDLGSPITPDADLGTGGWYMASGGGAFASGGTITFRNLTPGKTYRVVGIPVAAISRGLGTNLGPGAVLDNGYYSDSRIKAASSGGPESFPSYDLEIYQTSDHTNVRVKLHGARADAEYALLAQKAGTTGPAITGPAIPGTAWSARGPSGVVFEGLEPGRTYYLVARPAGYTEVGYAEAAYMDGDPSWVEIATPNEAMRDVTPGALTRSRNGDSIEVKITDSQPGYSYAAVNTATGKIESGPKPDTSASDGKLTLTGLSPVATYQVVTKLTGGVAYLQGVRVYPYPQGRLIADYSSSSIRLESGDGFIPRDMEYAIHPYGAGSVYFVGEPLVGTRPAIYVRGNGNSVIHLDDANVVSAGAVWPGESGNRLSLFDALVKYDSDVDASFDVRYRYAVDDGYAGPYVLPEVAMPSVPGRPAAPTGYTADWKAESLGASTVLEARGAGQASWSSIAAGGNVSFSALGWNGGSDQTVSLRSPYGTDRFTSFETPVVIPARRAAPSGLEAVPADPSDLSKGIIISGFDDDNDYEYRLAEGPWQTIPAGSLEASDGAILLQYDTDYGEYAVRFPASATSPASFYATVPSPLNIEDVNFGSSVYGDAIGQKEITIYNIVSDDITLDTSDQSGWGAAAVRVTGTGAERFALNTTAGATIAPNQPNTTYKITPKDHIPAGSYTLTFEARYKYDYGGGSKDYVAKGNIHLIVAQAKQDMSGAAGTVTDVSQGGFTVSVTGAAPGSKLEYSLNGGSFASDDSDMADEHGDATHTFNGLIPSTSYTVDVRAAGDTNHEESASRRIVTAYTLQATPDISKVLSIDYRNELMKFMGDCDPDSYTVRARDKDTGDVLIDGSSLAQYSDEGDFKLYVVRNAQPPYGQSAPAELSLHGKADAPALSPAGIVEVTPATTGKKNDGHIICAGSSFQYRLAGASIPWTDAFDRANVTSARYEVRLSPTADRFPSKAIVVRVSSLETKVTLHTKTYGHSGTAMEARSLPESIAFTGDGSSGWSTGESEGDYERDKLGVSVTLPVGAVSTTHIFRGWYAFDEDAGDFTGSAINSVPAEKDNYYYYAKWAARPLITSVATDEGAVSTVAALTFDPSTASRGLNADSPVKATVRLAPGDGKLALSDISLSGQKDTGALELCSDAAFSEKITGDVRIAWGDAPTKLYLRTTSSDDPDTHIYYELTVYATRSIYFMAMQTGGVPDVKTSTGVALTFYDDGEPIDAPGLTDGKVTITDGTGHAKQGTMMDSGTGYIIGLTDVSGGSVHAHVADWAGYTVSPSSVSADLYRDATPPTGEIEFRDNKFTGFLNTITFGLFFRNTVDVTVTPGDANGDGVDKTEYLLTAAAFGTPGDIIAADISWTSGEQGRNVTKFPIGPNQKTAVYAKITDRAGNVAVINSAGIVVYTGSGAAGDTKEIAHTKMSSDAKAANITFGGNSIESIVNDMGTPENGDDKELVDGTDYTALGELATDGSVTFRASYMDSLTASAIGQPYKLTISYRPLGEEYAPSAGAVGMDKPSDSSILLTVKKAASNVGLTASPPSGAKYGPVKLAATVTTASVNTNTKATGKVIFYKDAGTGSSSLGAVSLDSGKAELTVTLPAMSYNGIHAEYEGNGNYTSGSATLGAYEVAKAAQSRPTLHEGDSSGALGPSLSVKREDGKVLLTARGGESTGLYQWESEAPGVVDITSYGGVSSGSALLTIKAAGTSTVSAVRKGDSNYEDSKPVTLDLTVLEETTLPTPGGVVSPPDAAVSATAISSTRAAISWKAATDNITASEDIKYYVYLSTSLALDIGSDLDDWNGQGVFITSGAGITSAAVKNLTPGTGYWFNVIACDEAGNKAAYSANAQTVITPLHVSFTAKQYGGEDGKATTTAIEVTFDKAVGGFRDSQPYTITGGAATTNASPERIDDFTRRIPVTVTGENASLASITLRDWTDGNRQRYILDTPRTTKVAVYRPVPWPVPQIQIDYENAQLKDLEEGGSYKFSYNEGVSYGGIVRITTGGIYDHIPFGRTGYELYAVRVAAADEHNSDSPPQILWIPPRPETPVVDVVQPTKAALMGSLKVKNPLSDMIYEYSYATTGAVGPPWTTFAALTTLSGLAGGRYSIRVQASNTTVGNAPPHFASNYVTKTIHAYDEVRFDAQLQGYSLTISALTPQVVEAPAGEITSVTWAAIPGDKDAFTLTKSAVTGKWMMQPAYGLSCSTAPAVASRTYHAKITLTFSDSEPHDQDVWFTVHPRAEIASASAFSVDGEGHTIPGGLTNRLKLKFTYPIDLPHAAVQMGGGAEKPVSETAFTAMSDDMTEYTLAVKAHTDLNDAKYRTGDKIDVYVNLASLGDGSSNAYSEQMNQTSVKAIQPPTSAYPTVTIPRAIEKAVIFDVTDGYESGLAQFTLDHSKAPISPDKLEYSSPSVYPCPVVLTDGDGDGVVGSVITAIYRIDKDKGYTYRLYLDVTTPGSLKVSIPDWGVDPVLMSGSAVTGSSIPGYVFFLDSKWHSYPVRPTEPVQELDPLPAGPYCAPEITLPLSREVSEAAIKEVYLDGKAFTKYRQTAQPGAYDYYFENDFVRTLTSPMALTLEADWTREKGDHTITILYEDGWASQAVMDVRGITSTYPLAVTEGDGGAGAFAYSSYGIPANESTTKGAYASGASVRLTATPLAGYRFLEWKQTSGPEIAFSDPTSSSISHFTMTSAAVTIAAFYTDGTPPESRISPADGAWTSTGAVTITATDVDPTAAMDIGAASLNYVVDDGEPVESGSSIAAFTLDDEGPHEIEYWAVDMCGNEETHHKATINRDSTPPAGRLTVSGPESNHSYTGFTSKPALELFYKYGASVGVSAEGGDPGYGATGSGVRSVEYLTITTSGALAELAPFSSAAQAMASAGWETDAPAVSAKGKSVVYARVTDRAGNVSVVNTAGIVIYEDAATDTSSVYAYRMDDSPVVAKLSLNGNGIYQIRLDVNEHSLTLSQGSISAGAAYEVDESSGVVTFSGLYLGSLPSRGATGSAMDGYGLSLSYAPQGATASGIQPAPAPGYIELDVLKARPSVGLKVTAITQGGSYSPAGDAVLMATVTNASFAGGATATGIACFYDNLQDPSVNSSASSPADTDLIGTVSALNGKFFLSNAVLVAGDREPGDIYAVYSGDDNYHGGSGGLNSGYSVAKAKQPAPVITGAGVTQADATSYVITEPKIYGQAPFSVMADNSVADATGGYAWYYSGSVTPSGDAGSVGLIDVSLFTGNMTVTVRREGDGNYDASPLSTLNFKVDPRQVIIAGVGAKGKTYDGHATADVVRGGAELTSVPGITESGVIPKDRYKEILDFSVGEARFTGGGVPSYPGHPEYAGEGKIVTFAGFTLTGSGSSSYALVGQPAVTTASIAKATPEWTSMSPSGIYYGQTLGDSTTSGIK